MQFLVNLAAGARQRQQTQGRYFLILDTGAETTVEVWIMRGNVELEYVRTAKRGLKASVPEGFTHIELRAAGATACEIVISDGAVDLGFMDGIKVDATIISPTPLPVSNDRGTPGNLMHVAGVSIADAPATAIVNAAPVAASNVIAALAAADATRRALRFENLGPDPVAIGGAGLTWATRGVVLLAGDIWTEDRAANLAWYAITEAVGKAATVGVQGVTA